jgi:hypothetical protein
MPRPVKKRTAKTYRRDVEALGRLRTALLVDLEIDSDLRKQALDNIDTLIGSLAEILKEHEKQPTL